MDGGYGASGGLLRLRLVERLTDLDRLIAAERARSTPDEALIRRLSREKSLAKDRVAALGGCGMPRWAREDAAP
ncbi:YdcH family protein [Falsiroseomonas tokyonensis]|uniref:YdcH family protein n=1 Tax=Falsiroseomonas tokyonensis TaxID=430521 RepID=A0ABV7BSE4_9PROT|nr:YdcH family protein [Falsiroseomonas tokyonensis]MBU8537763.1 YdcH family protein [Falsiroseomonas tokyonensis]